MVDSYVKSKTKKLKKLDIMTENAKKPTNEKIS